MSSQADISNLEIEKSKINADGKSYFKLFEKHVPRDLGPRAAVCLYKLDNFSCMHRIIQLNPAAKYIVVGARDVHKNLKNMLPAAHIEYSEDTLFKKMPMTFDCIIMNPPYQRNLHLKILAEALKHLKDEKSVCVNLSPVLWIYDPHAHRKLKSNLYKFSDSILTHTDNIEIVNLDHANSIFGSGLFSDLGVYVCKKTASGIDGINFWKTRFSKPEIDIFEKMYDFNVHIEDVCENNKRDGIRVPIAFIAGNRGTLPIYKDLAYVVDGMKDGKDWTKCKNNGGYEKEEGIPIPFSIKFKTEFEAQNFYDSWKLMFLRYLAKHYIFDQNIQLQFLPFLGSATNPRTGLVGYKGEWTDEDLFQFFGLTDDEKKVVDETMRKYK